jgi:hypothetical protein
MGKPKDPGRRRKRRMAKKDERRKERKKVRWWGKRPFSEVKRNGAGWPKYWPNIINKGGDVSF